MSISDQIERDVNKILAIVTIEITEWVMKKPKEPESVIKNPRENQQ